LARGLLDLADDVFESGFGELIGVVFHVLLGVFVSANELELESAEENGSSDQEVLLFVVGLGDGRLVLLSLHELAANTAAVLIAHFVHLDGVVTAVEGDDETTVLIIGLGGDELRVETKDVHVLLEHFLHVELGDLRLEGDNASHGVLLGTVTVIFGHGLVLNRRGGLAEGNGDLGLAEVVLVPLLGVVVAIVDEAVSSEDSNLVTTFDVSRLVVFFSAHGHAGAVSEDGSLGELLSLQEHREGEATGVGGVDLLNFDGAIAEEVVQSVVLVTTVVAAVLPQNREGEHLAVVVEEALQVFVGTATLELNFDVVLEFSQIWRILLHVDHSTGLSEGVIGVSFGVTKVVSLVGVEGASEVVAIDNTEDTRVHVDFHGDPEVTPVVALGGAGLGDLVALKEDSLRNSGVLNAVLNDVKGIIIEVVVDDAATDAVVLGSIFDDGLLEVGFEVEDLNSI